MLFNLNRGVFTNRSYEYPGQSEFTRSGSDYMFALLTSNASGSVFRLFKSIPNADLCLVAGGKEGADGSTYTGGTGGEVVNVTGVFLPAGEYTATIGESENNTVLASPDGRTWTARSGYGSAGGDGANADGDPGAFAWGDSNTTLYPGWKYGAGGGRGYRLNNTYAEYASGNAGSAGAAPTDAKAGAGGESGHLSGYPGAANTGMGGGAGARVWNGSYYDNYDGGAGGSGIILIRKHKEVT